MKNLYHFLFENLFLFESDKNDIIAIYNGIMPNSTTPSPKHLCNPKHKDYEMFRLDFGKEESDVRANIQQFLTSLGFDANSFELQDYGVHNIASSKHPSIIVKFLKDTGNYYGLGEYKEGDIKYITNWHSESGIFDKTLSPSRLGLDIAQGFDSAEACVNACKESLKNLSIGNNVKDVLYQLLDSTLNVSKAEGTLNAFSNNDVIKCTLQKSESLASLSRKDIGIICRDFGEVLGGCALMSSLTEADKKTLYFPADEHAMLYDYQINDDVFVSAKSGHGAAASTKGVFARLNSMRDDGLIEPQNDKEKCVLDYIDIMVGDTNGKPDTQYNRSITLFNYVVKDKNIKNSQTFIDCVNAMKSIGVDFDELDGYKKPAFETTIRKAFKGDEDKFKEIILNVCNTYGYESTANVEKILNAGTFPQDSLIGVVTMPFLSAAFKMINDTYLRELSKFASISATGFQVYLTHDLFKKAKDSDSDLKQIVFTVKDMKQGYYVLRSKATINYPAQGAFSIAMDGKKPVEQEAE